MKAFERSGLASCSDLEAEGYAPLHAELEAVQREFLDALPRFRSGPDVRVSGYSMQHWSRIWEYPYVFDHLRTERRRFTQAPTVIDFGSGSAFFPFAVARLGTNVVCFDNQQFVVDDMRRAVATIPAGDGTIDVRLNDDRLPMESASAAMGYSVSVLEHMPDPSAMVAEIARVVVPGGLFLLTCDLDVERSDAIPPERYARLRSALKAHFDWAYPDEVIHPQQVLTTKNSPIPADRYVPGLLYRDKQGVLHPLVGGPPPGIITAYGCALRRR